mmetsp:Transcript_25746/g.4327  ORF Transcript_25746/g.4327 Transcript_25746/m.4327 type:complete len:159 (+) Transcript_25746:523-999(+)
MTAAIGVVLDKNANTQRFFGAGNNKDVQGHTDDITALAISPNRDLVVTGQVGSKPILYVWNPSNPEANPVCRMDMGRGKRAVTAVCFSNDQTKVAAVGLDDDHTVIVFDAARGNQLCSDKTGPDKVLDVAWCQSGNRFCTVGIKHVCFWEVTNGALTK